MVTEIWWGQNRAASKIAILGVSKFAGLHGPFAARILLKNALFSLYCRTSCSPPANRTQLILTAISLGGLATVSSKGRPRNAIVAELGQNE